MAMNGGHASGAQPGGLRQRMHSRRKQGLVHIDVAHAGQERLVEQQRFNAGLAPLDARLKFVESDGERLGAEARQVVIPQNTAELALVSIN